jgi:hypothetical protein
MVIKMHINDSQNIIPNVNPNLENSSPPKSTKLTVTQSIVDKAKIKVEQTFHTVQQTFRDPDYNEPKSLILEHKVRNVSLYKPLLEGKVVDEPKSQWVQNADKLVQENKGKYEAPKMASPADYLDLNEPLSKILEALERINDVKGRILTTSKIKKT